MNVSVIPVGFGARGMIPQSLVKELGDLEIRGQAETP